MAVDIKSLRIGSHVAICGGERVRVTALRSNGIITTTLGDMDESNLTPISLTPELLKELGFELYANTSYLKRWRLGDLILEHEDTDVHWDFNGDMLFVHLHELEALYYHVYEEELIKD